LTAKDKTSYGSSNKTEPKGCGVVLAQVRTCSPTCSFFKCVENSIAAGNMCRLTEEKCDVANCGYAICVKRRLLPRGICGETVKRRTVEKEPDEVIGPSVKLRGRALRKFGEKEIF
jgi:hypothetical protein